MRKTIIIVRGHGQIKSFGSVPKAARYYGWCPGYIRNKMSLHCKETGEKACQHKGYHIARIDYT